MSQRSGAPLPANRAEGNFKAVSTLAEIESAVEMPPPGEQRELFDFLASKLKSQSGGAAVFPDLKALLLAMPDAWEDADFSRVREI